MSEGFMLNLTQHRSFHSETVFTANLLASTKKNMCHHPENWKYITLEEDRAMAADTCTENFVKFKHVVFEIC